MPDAGLLAGLFSGITSTAILHPIDLIKVRFQVQDAARPSSAPSANERVRYRGIVDAARSILREDGVRGLYRGVVPGMLGSGLSWGLYFFFYERLKARLRTWSAEDGQAQAKLGPAGHMSCAVAAGCSTVLVTNPVWLVKTRLQLQHDVAIEGEPRPYRGLVGEHWRPRRSGKRAAWGTAAAWRCPDAPVRPARPPPPSPRPPRPSLRPAQTPSVPSSGRRAGSGCTGASAPRCC